MITEAEVEYQRQMKEYKLVEGEKNTIGGLLIKRNEELAVVYEKVRVQQSVLLKGEKIYRQRLDEL